MIRRRKGGRARLILNVRNLLLEKGWIVDEGTVYHGARGRYHYFLCLQLILRHQIAALTKLWELPPEFEVDFAT